MLIRLRIRRRPDDPPEDREFRVEALRLGRAPSADLVIPDDAAQTVSWQHARIDNTPDGIVLSDLKSTNGTYLNGRRVESPERLRVGDMIRFGQTGPTLEIVVLDANSRVSSPPPIREARSAPPPPLPRRDERTPAPPVRAAHAAPQSATRALLVTMQKKQRVWMIGAAAALLIVGVVLTIILIRHETRLDSLEEQMAEINAKFVDFETDLETVQAKQAEIDASTQTWYADFDSLDKAASSGNANNETIYQRTVRSTAWVIADRGGDGSGSLVEHNGRLLVVTSYHVIHGATRIGVRFPQVLDGKVLANHVHYIRDDSVSNKQTIPCSIWASDPNCDIAILEPVNLPPQYRPLRIAGATPQPGADVHTVGGDPAGTNALWSYTCGTVRQIAGPVELRTRSGRTVHATIVETQNPVNRGDSGGPLVNNKCELVGVTFGGVDGANLVTRFIEIGHVKEVLQKRPKKVIPTHSPSFPAVPPKVAPKVPGSPPANGHVHALLIIDDTDDRRPNGKRGIGQSVRVDRDNVRAMLRSGLPPGTFTIDVLQGKEANRSRITKHFQELRGKVAPADTIFCYYSGHGCTDRTTGAHYFAMNGGGWLGPKEPAQLVPRAEVLTQMRGAGGKFVVLITDCCSSYIKGETRDGPDTTEFSRIQFLNVLLRRHSGVVDWQAASPGEAAVGNNLSGGLFTKNLVRSSGTGIHTGWSTLFNDVHAKTLKESGGNKRPLFGAPPKKPQTPYQFPTTSVRRD